MGSKLVFRNQNKYQVGMKMGCKCYKKSGWRLKKSELMKICSGNSACDELVKFLEFHPPCCLLTGYLNQ